MNTTKSVLNIFLSRKINWQLLLFLVLLLNVKLVVKVFAIVFIYALNRNFKFKLALKNSRLPLFYPIVIVIALLNAIIYVDITEPNYYVVLLIGIGLWCIGLLAVHQIKLFIEKEEINVIENTIVAFFIINSCVSFLTLISIIIETGSINPYTYQGNFQKYFLNTGDYIKGITLDTSVTNAALNAFGVIFFLYRKNWVLLFFCLTTLLLTVSNLINLILFALLAFIFILRKDKIQRSITTVCFMFLIIFMIKVSPQNNQYLKESFERITNSKNKSPVTASNKKPLQLRSDSELSTEEKKQKIALLFIDSVNLASKEIIDKHFINTSFITEEKIKIPEPNIHTPPYQNRDDTSLLRKELIEFISSTKYKKIAFNKNVPGKFVALKQCFSFFLVHPKFLILGIGLGNFSSKMAFKATALQFAGGYPKNYQYINQAFFQNHLSVYLYFFSSNPKKHSITNSPNSTYTQVISEYGILGSIAFIVFYLGYFIKHFEKLTYGIPLIFFLCSIFFFDYWFEQLSVVIMFELMLLLNIKEEFKSK